MACAAAYLLWVTRDSGFYQDELTFVYTRLDFSPDTLFEPFVNNLTAITLLVYQTTIKVFGLDDARLPIRVIWIAMDLTCSLLLFLYLRRRTLAWFAFLPSCLLLVFGAAWTYTATTLGLLEFMAVALGLGALLALDRRSRGGDLAATGLLAAALFTHSASLPFVVGAAATVLVQGVSDARRRAWIVAVPLALYLAWLVWAHFAHPGSPAELANVLKAPKALLDGMSTVLAAIGGRYLTNDAGRIYALDKDPGIVVSLFLGAWIVWLAVRRRFPREALVGLAMLLAYWFIIALVISPARQPTADRYLYLGVVLLAIAIAPLLPRRSPPLFVWAAIAVAFVSLSLAPNIRALSQSAENVKTVTDETRAGLTALELARGSMAAGFDANDAVPGQALYLPPAAGSYLAIVDRYGSPALSEAALRDRDDDTRRVADAVLVAALRLRVEAEGELPAGKALPACTRPSRVHGVVRVPAGAAIAIAANAGEDATVSAARFADDPTVALGRVPAGETGALVFPRDRAGEPWRLRVSGGAVVRACG